MATKVAAKTVSEKPTTILDQLKKLDADRSKLDEARKELLEGAKNELLAQRTRVCLLLGRAREKEPS